LAGTNTLAFWTSRKLPKKMKRCENGPRPLGQLLQASYTRNIQSQKCAAHICRVQIGLFQHDENHSRKYANYILFVGLKILPQITALYILKLVNLLVIKQYCRNYL
jgi:hypothetical protein